MGWGTIAVIGLVVVALLSPNTSSFDNKQEDTSAKTEYSQVVENEKDESGSTSKTETTGKAESDTTPTKNGDKPKTTASPVEEEKLYEFGTWTKRGETKRLKWRKVTASADGETIMLCCTEAVASMPYKQSTVVQATNWERSDVRAWLNGDFYNQAFSEDEKAQIVTTSVVDYGGDNKIGGTTQDNVFILSINQANAYLGSSKQPWASWYLNSYSTDLYKYISTGEKHNYRRVNESAGVWPAITVNASCLG